MNNLERTEESDDIYTGTPTVKMTAKELGTILL